MKFIIAPDKFKGSLTASAVCNAVEHGVKQFDANIDIVKIPLADGGEGTLNIFESYSDYHRISVIVTDPLFRPIEASYLLNKTTAYIEMSAASGLQLLKENERNCLYTSTYGTGELILDACNKGAEEIFLFVGGSATNDAGMGMAAALGYQFLDKQGIVLKPIGENLTNVYAIKNHDLKISLAKTKFTVVCDVKNPLHGKDGAAHVYAKQKGADTQAIKLLDEGLENFAFIIEKTTKKQVANVEGGGAAGGIAAGAIAFLNANIKPGIATILDIVNFKNQLKNTDLVITGEGKIDAQTLAGKVVYGVAEICKKNDIPVIAVTGNLTIQEDKLSKIGVGKVYSLTNGHNTTQEAITNAKELLEKIAFKLTQIFVSKS